MPNSTHCSALARVLFRALSDMLANMPNSFNSVVNQEGTACRGKSRCSQKHINKLEHQSPQEKNEFPKHSTFLSTAVGHHNLKVLVKSTVNQCHLAQHPQARSLLCDITRSYNITFIFPCCLPPQTTTVVIHHHSSTTTRCLQVLCLRHLSAPPKRCQHALHFGPISQTATHRGSQSTTLLQRNRKVDHHLATKVRFLPQHCHIHPAQTILPPRKQDEAHETRMPTRRSTTPRIIVVGEEKGSVNCRVSSVERGVKDVKCGV